MAEWWLSNDPLRFGMCSEYMSPVCLPDGLASCVSGNAHLRAEEVGHAMTVAVKKERRACRVNPTFSGPLSTLVLNCVSAERKTHFGKTHFGLCLMTTFQLPSSCSR
ncbi:unnamed protein product [Sphagnum jensenii]